MRAWVWLIPPLLLAAACTKNSDAGGTHRINGSIHVIAGQDNGDVATVNGAISIDDKAHFGVADTVNGDVWVGAQATGRAVKTVNGSVTLDKGARLSGEVSSVNGSLTLNDNADVGAQISNVNGSITLNDAHVAQGIATVDGDININGHSRIEGGIHVHKLSAGLIQAAHEAPRIIIGPGVVVQGELKFDRSVKLFVSDKATIGAVIGATAVTFSGDKPTL